MSGTYDQWLLAILKFVPSAGSAGMLLYCLVTGKVPVRGRTILKSDQPSSYWSTLVVFVIIVALPCLYLALS